MTIVHLLIINSDYWGRVENRKSFFISYANERGFDPFHADSWLAEPINNIVSFKVCFYHFVVYHFVYLLYLLGNLKSFKLSQKQCP